MPERLGLAGPSESAGLAAEDLLTMPGIPLVTQVRIGRLGELGLQQDYLIVHCPQSGCRLTVAEHFEKNDLFRGHSEWERPLPT